MSFSLAPPARGHPMMRAMLGMPEPAPPSDNAVNMIEYRPNSLNQPFRFRDVLKSGKVTLGTGFGFISPEGARFVANQGYDWVFLDGEHTPMGPDKMAEMVKTINYASEGTTAVLVRVPDFGHSYIAWALDAGASGIIVPHSETAEQARKVVQAARFPFFGGKRSFPPFAHVPGGTDGAPEGSNPLQVWSQNGAVIMQIESLLGCENAEEICAVEGVDAIMIGPGDLRMDLGLAPGQDGPEPEFQRCLDLVQKAAAKYNLPILGFALGPDLLTKRYQQGWRGFLVAADYWAAAVGMSMALNAGRAEVDAAVKQFGGAKPLKAVNGHSNGEEVHVDGQTNGVNGTH